MPTICEILFDNPTGVYYAGQQLSGTAVLNTDHEKTIRAIHIEINGLAKVRWSETKTRSENGKTKTYTVHYTAHEQYIASRTYTAGYEGGPSFNLAPGNYTYTFRCFLPAELPTTFDGHYGHIKYEAILTIDRPYRFDNVFKQAFTVIHPVDLNFDPRFRWPGERADEKQFCCFCCASGPCEIKLYSSHTGYAPGQKLNFVLAVSNESTVDINSCKVELKKTISYHSTSPEHKTRYQSEYVGEKRFGQVLRLSKKEFRDHIVVPSIPPTSTDSCRCIKISYELVGRASPGGCHRDLRVEFPITIGTVPILNLTPGAPSPGPVVIDQPIFNPSAPTIPITGGDVPPSYDSFVPPPPPSYEDATLTGNFVDPDEIKHKSGPFVPKYPVYHNYCAPPPNAPPAEE